MRLEKGESDILEKTSAEGLLTQIELQQNQLVQDAKVFQLEFQLLLNTQTVLQPFQVSKKFSIDVAVLDTLRIKDNNTLAFLAQQEQISIAMLKLEKSRMLPDLSIGYANSSIRGVGADDRYYNSSYRFNIIQLGVGFPLFSGSQLARIKSAQIGRQIARDMYGIAYQSIKADFDIAEERYKSARIAVDRFEQYYLKTADLINETANKQLAAGNINSLEWAQLVNQAISIRNGYADAIRKFNDAIIQLNYLINK